MSLTKRVLIVVSYIIFVSSLSDSSQEVHYWVTTLLILKVVHPNHLAAGSDTFHSTPSIPHHFPPRMRGRNDHLHAPLFHEEVKMLKSNPSGSTASKQASSLSATASKQTTFMRPSPASTKSLQSLPPPPTPRSSTISSPLDPTVVPQNTIPQYELVPAAPFDMVALLQQIVTIILRKSD